MEDTAIGRKTGETYSGGCHTIGTQKAHGPGDIIQRGKGHVKPLDAPMVSWMWITQSPPQTKALKVPEIRAKG